MTNVQKGPLAGINILEFAGLGPVPFAASILADMGARVVHVVRPDVGFDTHEPQLRGRHVVALDMKSPEGLRDALTLVRHSHILLEGYRPGVMERFGLGPDVALAENKSLVYGRMTGWGQTGPLAHEAGHDVNYLSITGVLNAIGPAEKPAIPLNLIGDFGGGSMFLLTGVLAALHQARTTGEGNVVDTAMVDGVSALAGSVIFKQSRGEWSLARDSNYIDGGMSRYSLYECADGKFVALGPIEPQFYENFRKALGLKEAIFDMALKPETWHAQREALMAVFKQRSRDAWIAMTENRDTCLSPVLDFEEARTHPHLLARDGYRPYLDGILPAAAPRFSSFNVPPPEAPKMHSCDEIVKLLQS